MTLRHSPPRKSTLQVEPPASGERTPPPGAGSHAAQTWRSRLYRWEGRSAPYVYISPFFVAFGAFGLFPLLYTGWISLHQYRLGGRMNWNGIDNFVWLFSNPSFYNSLWKTFTIGVISTVPQLLMALGLAHLLNYKLRGRTFFRVVMLMPYATSVAAATLVFMLIFGRDQGVINGLIGLVGIEPIDWRNGDWTAQIAISVIVTWHWTGYNALIYLAGMQSISKDLYEAAAIDGANRWHQFLHVTVPGLRPTIVFTIIISTIGASQLFAEPLLFGGGTPNGGSVSQYQTLGLFMYEQGWHYGQLGRGATVAWVMFVLIVGLVLLNMRLSRMRRAADEDVFS